MIVYYGFTSVLELRMLTKRSVTSQFNCNGIATRASVVGPTHALTEAVALHVEICERLFETRASEHFLHMMERSARLK